MRMRREQRAFFACMQIVVPLVALLLNELGIPGSWLMIVATVLYAFTAVRGSIWMLIGCPLAAGAGVYLVSGDIMSAVNVVLGFVPVGLSIGLLIKYGKKLKACIMAGTAASIATYCLAIVVGAFFTHKKITVDLFFGAYMTTFSKVEEAFSLLPKNNEIKEVYIVALFRNAELIERFLPAVMMLSAMAETFAGVCIVGWLLEKLHVKTMLVPLYHITLMRRSAVVFVFSLFAMFMFPNQIVGQAFANLALILGCLFFVAGLSLIHWFLRERMHYPPLVIALSYLMMVMAAVTPFFFIDLLCVILGLWDCLANPRKIST